MGCLNVRQKLGTRNVIENLTNFLIHSLFQSLIHSLSACWTCYWKFFKNEIFLCPPFSWKWYWNWHPKYTQIFTTKCKKNNLSYPNHQLPIMSNVRKANNSDWMQCKNMLWNFMRKVMVAHQFNWFCLLKKMAQTLFHPVSCVYAMVGGLLPG